MKVKNLIFNVFAFKEKYTTSTQIEDQARICDIYLKNSFVSLMSAKKHNPEDDFCLIVNYDIPEYFSKLFSCNSINIIKLEYSEFVFPVNFQWSLAFFKLCALNYAVNNLDYDKYLLLDTDTFTVNNYIDIWKEAEDNILLLNIGHRYSHPHRKEIMNSYRNVYGEEKKIIHYGGEFIVGNRGLLKNLVNNCMIVYKDIVAAKFNIDRYSGDEMIISIAATKMREAINDACPYIYRYWTNEFYLVSTNYKNNAVDIWHVPSAKQTIFILLFEYYMKNNRFPSNDKCAKMFGFAKAKRKINFYYIKSRVNTFIIKIAGDYK